MSLFERLKQKRREQQFSRDYEKLTTMIYEAVCEADSLSEVEEQIKMLESLADHNVLDSSALLGCIYMMEEKAWFDAEKAKLYLEPGAQAGNAGAQFNLGLLYYQGKLDRGADPVSGLYWIKMAAEQGFPYAKDFLYKRENDWDK